MAEIEEEKQFLLVKSEKLLEFVYENALSKDAEVKEIFLLHLNNVMDSEEGLLKHYETYLDKSAAP